MVITHAIKGRQANGGTGIREGVRIYTESAAPLVIRSREQIAAWFDGFTLVPPGLVAADDWRRMTAGGPGTAR